MTPRSDRVFTAEARKGDSTLETIKSFSESLEIIAYPIMYAAISSLPSCSRTSGPSVTLGVAAATSVEEKGVPTVAAHTPDKCCETCSADPRCKGAVYVSTGRLHCCGSHSRYMLRDVLRGSSLHGSCVRIDRQPTVSEFSSASFSDEQGIPQPGGRVTTGAMSRQRRASLPMLAP